MKRRIIAGLLSLIMVLSLFPAALAVDENSDTNILEQEEETLPDQAGPCTKTEGCILPEGHEGECSVAPEIPGEELETTPPEESEQEPASEEGTETETGDFPESEDNSLPPEDGLDGQAVEPQEEIPPAAENAVYVSEDGNDTGKGTRDDPYKTLSKAVEKAPDGATIYVMSDLIMTESARFWNKHLTITSLDAESPVTLERGEPFASVQDPARGGYNGALIEVGGSWFHQESSLTLENIILDDAGLRGGDTGGEDDETYFIQAASDGDGDSEFGILTIANTDIVQDAMIATYNNTADITLGKGAVLKNYGGMSAVRVSGGVLTMETGSVICDDMGIVRIKGSEIPGENGSNISGLYGPAGAVWLQGGALKMESGSEICDIDGRAIYNEAGDVLIDGTISDITSNNAMWQGTSGFIMHMRVSATATLGSNGVIDGGSLKNSGNAIEVLGNLNGGNGPDNRCTFTAEAGSVIRDIDSGATLNISGTASLDGEITGCTSHVITAQYSIFKIEIGENAEIHDNRCAYGVIYAQADPDEKGNCGVIDLYGKINNNLSTDRGGAIAMANNASYIEINMYPGAEMCNNVSTQTGGAVLVSDGKFTMYGGTISGNISGAGRSPDGDAVGGGVYVRRGGQFVMNGGEITHNSAVGTGGGIAFDAGDYNGTIPYIQLNGGTISDNKMNATVTGDTTNGFTAEGGENNEIAVTGGSGHVNRYLTISGDMTIRETGIFMDKYDFSIELPDGVKLGNAAAACETAAEAAIAEAYQNLYVAAKGSFWYQSGDIRSASITGLDADSAKPLFVAVVETDENGLPASDAKVAIQAANVENGRITLPLWKNTNGYAVVFVQERDASGIVTVVPADMTAYMGGADGYEGVIGNGEITVGSTSFPHPLFRIQAPAGVDVTALDFQNGSNHWKAVPVNPGTSGTTYYRFEKAQGTTTEVRVQYDNGAGPVMEDQFDPEESGEVFQNYLVTIYGGTNGTGGVQAGTGSEYYSVLTGTGVLTVRAVEDAQSTAVKPVQAQAVPAASGSAVAVVTGGTIYTLNDTDVVLPAAGTAPSLLFDSIITSDGVDRLTPLQDKADEVLGHAEGTRCYEIKYLDLVDANNGNAWISSNTGVDIYWGYPEGTDAGTDFTLLHFQDLHRDGAQSGFDVQDIEDCTVSVVTAENTGYGLKFHVDKGGFSPFALVWETAGRPVDPDPDPTPGAGGGEDHDSEPYLRFDSNGGTAFDPIDGDGRDFNINPYEDSVYGTHIPSRPGYRFTGWYKDTRLTMRVDENERIHVGSAMTLFAGWAESSVPSMLNGDDHYAYIQGYADGTVRPNANITRAQVATIFFRLLDEDVRDNNLTTYNTFPDVNEDYWANTAISTMAALGVINGRSNGHFDPNANITRAEFAAICARFDESGVTGITTFTDTNGHWAEEEISRAAALGWIQGYADGTFRPKQYITRAQAVTMINRMLCRQPETADDLLNGMRIWSDCQEGDWFYLAIQEATNSHDFTAKDRVHESWTDLNKDPDWSRYE